MQTSIDWLTFTIPLHSPEIGDDANSLAYLFSQCELSLSPALFKFLSFEGEIRKAHGFYAHLMIGSNGGARLSWGGVNNHAMIEMPGTACATASQCGVMGELLTRIAERVSRIDFAGDIETDVTPLDFVTQADLRTNISRTSIDSATGLTEYIGSRSSTRFCRVYRYAEPHDRAKFLRVEFELKGKLAQAAAIKVTEIGVVKSFTIAANSYRFKHPVWASEIDNSIEGRYSAPNALRTNATRILWFKTQVTPALVQMHKDRVIDLRLWFNEVVAPLLGDD
jgi:DNA relaxase NicK